VSAEVRKVEVDGKEIAFGRSDVDGSRAGGKGIGWKVELEGGANELATTFIRAKDIRLAGRRERFELLVLAGNLNVEILPEIVGTRDEAFSRTGGGTGGANDIRAIGSGELDLNNDSYIFGLIAMIKGGLLGAVAGSVLAGLLDEKGERSEESNGIDVRASLGGLQELCVFVEESSHGLIAALAKEIGFANGLVGERSVEGKGGRRREYERCED
jgi:hypothetical protein